MDKKYRWAVILSTWDFKYLGFIIQKDGEIDSDVNHKIQAGWLKWRSTTEVLCDRNIHLWLKGVLSDCY